MNQQRGFVPVQLIIYVVAGLVALATVGAVIYKVRHWCNVACEEAKEETAEAREEVDATKAAWKKDTDTRIARTTELTLLLSGKLSAALDEAKRQEAMSNDLFAVVSARVSAIPRGPTVSVPRAVARVLDDASSAANAGRTDANAGTETRADAIPEGAAPVAYDQRELAEYFAGGPAAYADAYNLWRACRVREDAYLQTCLKGPEP